MNITSHPNSSISVVSFSICQNLVEKFNAIENQVNPIVDLSGETDSVLLSDNSVGSSRGVGMKRITPSIKSSNFNVVCIVEGNAINLTSVKENDDLEAGGELLQAPVTAKLAKGRGKRHLLKDDSEPLKEMQTSAALFRDL